MVLSAGSKAGLLLVIFALIVLVIIGGYFLVQRMTPPPTPPSPMPQPSSHHSPSPSTLTPIYQGIGTPTAPKSATDAYIISMAGVPFKRMAWSGTTGSSPDTIDISTSPNDFNISPASGKICKTANTDWCVGIDTSGSPSSGDKLTLADTTQLSQNRLRNFVWNTGRVPWPSGLSPSTPSAEQPLIFCLTGNDNLCAVLAGTSSPVQLATVEVPSSTNVWVVEAHT